MDPGKAPRLPPSSGGQPRPILVMKAAPIHLLAFLYATVGGSGLLRPAPGTWGSIPGFLLFAAMAAADWSAWAIALWTALTLALAVPASDLIARRMGAKDPGSIVADETFAVPLALWPLLALPSIPWPWWLGAFLLYRLFDIWKPWPARQLERLPGGLGIVMDDVASAAWCGLLLWGLVQIIPAR